MPFTDVDLGELTRDVVDMFRPRADGQEVALTFAEPPAVPVVRGSAGDLERVVQNLVSNAVKFTRAGGVVTVSLEHRDQGLVLTCADDGIGISAHDQERLFTEFFRGTNPEGLKVPGTGLGLSIAHRVVERHGGRLEVESELGRGTSVTLLLPVS
jgi:signal transduction histidine kinase